MSIQAVAWALDQEIPDAGLKLVLIALCNHADKSTGECYPSIQTLEREASMSRRSVQRRLADLLNQGLIEAMATFAENGRQMANSYRVVFDDAEQSRLSEARERQSLLDQFAMQNRTAEASGEGASLTPSQPVENLVSQGGTNASGGVTADTGEGVSSGTPEGVTADTPIRNLQKKPLEETFAGAREETDGFEVLWRKWPVEHRPGDKRATELMFERLDGHDRELANEIAPTWLRRQVLLELPRGLQHYLKSKGFRELDGAPPFDSDGDFRITPQRPEWQPWLEDVKQRNGEKGVETVRGWGFYLTKTRWPKGYQPPAKQIGLV